MKKIVIHSPENCCGCTACASSCKYGAISMCPDEYGFIYPKIDESKCIDCGLCSKMCQFKSDYKRFANYDEPFVYAARQINLAEVSKSQTGGMAAMIYRHFFKDGDIAYGVKFDLNFNVIHACARTTEEAQSFRGSKYVQSDLKGIFPEVKQLLSLGQKVLFIGTPCQVSGLKAYLPVKLHTKLFTVDLICHCNTAPGIWKSYVEYLQHRYKSKIVKADFRNKRFGWHKCLETYEFENGKELITRSYDYLFFDHLNSRPSCTNCPYTNFNRVSDITIGDYWGWEEHHSEFNDNLGLNLVLVNSEKGLSFFKECMPFLDFVETSIIDCLQPQLVGPIKKNPKQIRFLEDYKNRGIGYVLYRYGDKNIIFRFKKFLYTLYRLIKK